MAEADKDGRMALFVGDLIACLGMELAESVRELQAEFPGDLSDAGGRVEP